MNLTIRNWIFCFGRVIIDIIYSIVNWISSCKRWIIDGIDSASWWIALFVIMAVFSLVAAVFRILIEEHLWIIFILDLVFCFSLFILSKSSGSKYSRKKKILSGITFLLLVAVAAATFGFLDRGLGMLNVFIFPALFIGTIMFSTHLKKK